MCERGGGCLKDALTIAVELLNNKLDAALRNLSQRIDAVGSLHHRANKLIDVIVYFFFEQFFANKLSVDRLAQLLQMIFRVVGLAVVAILPTVLSLPRVLVAPSVLVSICVGAGVCQIRAPLVIERIVAVGIEPLLFSGVTVSCMVVIAWSFALSIRSLISLRVAFGLSLE